MATTTKTTVTSREQGRAPGVMRTMFDRMVAAREREAKQYIANHMGAAGRYGLVDGRQSLFEGQNRER